MNKINITEIEEYFEFFSSEVQTFCLLTKDSKGVIPGFGTIFASKKEIIETLKDPLCPECTLHMCLNLTNDKGRRTEDIVSAQAFCLDIDEPLTEEEFWELYWEISPHLVIKSDPRGKYHFYWKCDVPIIRWSYVQLALAWKFNGDLNLRSPAKTIRVPGVERVLKTGEVYIPTIFRNNSNLFPTITNSDIESFCKGRISEWHEQAQNSLKELSRERSKAFRDMKKNNIMPMLPKNTEKLGRNETLYKMCQQYIKSCKTAGNPVIWENVYSYGISVNQGFSPPLSQSEFSKTLNSVFKRN